MILSGKLNGPFDEVVGFEIKEARADALRARVQWMFENDLVTPIGSETNGEQAIPRVDIRHGDCNEGWQEVAPERGEHALVFADNEGANVYYETLMDLVDRGADVMVLLNHVGLARALGREFKGPPDPASKCAKFLGPAYEALWRERLRLGEVPYHKVVDAYVRALRESSMRVKKLEVYSGSEGYTLLYFTKERKTGNPWMSAFDQLERNLREVKRIVGVALDRAAGIRDYRQLVDV